MSIFANKINIGKNVELSPDTEIICDRISIGEGTVITGNTKITCKECAIGKNNFLSGVLIEGSLNAGNTRIKIGDECMILQNTRLNCNDYLEIGNDVNTGDVKIFTHSSSMNVFKGYPFHKAPVKIGSHVWINIGSIILPHVTIGSNVIIANNSVVNKDIPDSCFAGGVPARIIKENAFPKKLDSNEKQKIMRDCIKEYKVLLELKPFSATLKVIKNQIMFETDGKRTYFDCDTKEIKGEINKFSEDFRDFLRYQGIKFFTGKPFKSVLPTWYIDARSPLDDTIIFIK